MNIKTLHSVQTGFSADTVEWCPTDGFQEYFICGTYHLEERTDLALPTRRNGQVDLYKYDQLTNVLDKTDSKNTAAILDSKWSQLSKKPVLAAATALGEVLLYELVDGKINLITSVHLDSDADTLLTLAISWNAEKEADKLLIASDSQGSISLLKPIETGVDIVARWKAHSFEAWTCCFDNWNNNVIYTGGDDALIHAYDIRTDDNNSRKVMTNKTHMAGVTALNSLIDKEHILVTGSYDDHLRLFDVRRFSQPISSIDLKGGVWRIKTDPFKKDLLLCACMYHNVSIVKLNQTDLAPQLVAEYFEHKSINYGADWCRQKNDQFMYLATCSFYDQKLCISRAE